MWQEFHSRHFSDRRRAWFSQLAHTKELTPSSRFVSAPNDTVTDSIEALEDRWTELAPGETEEEWQAKYGFEFLTPGAARVFDTSRRFRERRDRINAEENEIPQIDTNMTDTTAAKSSINTASTECASLSDLRERAFAAKRAHSWYVPVDSGR
jgi:hypothetical protein